MTPFDLGIGDRPIVVALVNNMPDGAFLDTEGQFRRATAALGRGRVAFELYAITELGRSDRIASEIEARYRSLDELWMHTPDALIITGTEPREPHLSAEPCWPHLVGLLEWAASCVPTTLLSCLAAHASVLLFDGIERVRRPRKCSGVFEGLVRDPLDPLVTGLPRVVGFPHSRLNDVPEWALVDAGYRILVGSERSPAGWAVAAREQGSSLFVLCQCHPEYGALSLLREYRRDVRRYLSGQAPEYPRLPEGYLGDDATKALGEFEDRAVTAAQDPVELLASFPYEEVAATVKKTWSSATSTLYSNWLRYAQVGARAGV